MTDLSLAACQAFWESYQEKSVSLTVALMEKVETWTFDMDEEVEKRLAIMGKCLDNYDGVSLDEIESLITICAYLKISRMLYILQAVDKALPGGAAKILAHAEQNEGDNAHIRLFLKRNVTFERLRLLHTLFHPDRINIVNQALEASS